MPTKPAGITAVAQEAGVSISTVSQVLGGNRPVSDRTREKVNEAIQKLGYRPDPAARSLRNQRTESVALIVPDITNPFYPLAAVGMQDVLLPAGYLLSVTEAGGRSANVSQVIDHVLSRRFDGIALGTYGLAPADLKKIEQSGTRVVAFGRDIDVQGSDCVESDDAGGFVTVTEHLLSTGRRSLAFIAGEEKALPNRLRVRGFRSTLADAGLPAQEPVYTSFTREGGREGVDRLMDRGDSFDAIVCANDLIAIGAIERLRELDLSVPRDVAVTGYDDIEAASLVSPSLTTVENPAREIGRTAARLLLSRFNGTVDSEVSQHIVLSNRHVIRESTAAHVPTPEER